MTVPHYINANQNRFPATRNASTEAFSQHMNRDRLSCVHDLVETIDTRSASRAAPAEVQPGTAP